MNYERITGKDIASAAALSASTEADKILNNVFRLYFGDIPSNFHDIKLY